MNDGEGNKNIGKCGENRHMHIGKQWSIIAHTNFGDVTLVDYDV